MHRTAELEENIRLLRELRAEAAERLLAGNQAMRPLHLAVQDLLEYYERRSWFDQHFVKPG